MKLTKNLLVGFAALAIISCDDDDSNTIGTAEALVETTSEEEVAVSDINANYASIVYANYSAAFDDAVALQTSLSAFVAEPTDENFTAAKTAWFASRESYGTTEAFRFANGPIDVIGEEEGPEGLLNSWPLDENFIDYVSTDGMILSGIINDDSEITAEALAARNGEGDSDANVSVGYHAIEFLLWGQDLTDPSENLPGQRAFTDYLTDATTATAANGERRGQYLNACADLLIENLQIVLDQWAEGGAYRTEFEALDDETTLTTLLASIGELSKSELAVERMDVALANQDQEDEHSCFSDNTHRDIALNFQGIENVYFGEYDAISGASIHDLLEQEDSALALEVVAAFELADSSINAIAIPFDLAISEGAESDEGAKVKTAVDALQTLGDTLVTVATALGVTIEL